MSSRSLTPTGLSLTVDNTIVTPYLIQLFTPGHKHRDALGDQIS